MLPFLRNVFLSGGGYSSSDPNFSKNKSDKKDDKVCALLIYHFFQPNFFLRISDHLDYEIGIFTANQG